MQEHECLGATPVINYSTAQGIRSVSASDTISVLRAETIIVGASILVFAPDDVVTLSLRSGRAIAMHITRVPNRTLMVISRWRSLGFMVYIQQ